MDEQTALVLALQLVALFSIAGALLMYLLCKIRAGSGPESTEAAPGGGKAVLVTSADSAVGLQISIHLANRGFRVFAGLKNGSSSGSASDSVASKVIRAWQKHRESLACAAQGALVALPLDVTREDLLHEAVDIIRAHLPAGKDGIWAVINTSGLAYRGRLDQQNITHWDAMLKTNVVGVLRTARTFQGLLRNTGGRILTLGSGNLTCERTTTEDTGLVAYNASRYAVEGASSALRQEVAALGIKVVILRPAGIAPEMLFVLPKLIIPNADDNTDENNQRSEVSVDVNNCDGEGVEYEPKVLNTNALHVLDMAISSRVPKYCYTLSPKSRWMQSLSFVKVV